MTGLSSVIHRDLVSGYRRYFGKYAGRQDAQHTEQVFDNVPAQLALNRDGSVDRYRFKGVLPTDSATSSWPGPSTGCKPHGWCGNPSR